MSKPTKSVQPWLLLLALVVVGGGAVGVARLVASRNATVAAVDASPVSDGKRYKVPVSMSQPTRGATEPLVTIVEWCDLSGESCRQADITVRDLLSKYDGRLRHVWRHFPEPSEDSRLAHELARIAHEQGGKFWEMRAKLLERPGPLTQDSAESYGAAVGLDLPALRSAFERHSHAGYVAADGLFAAKFGVTQAPTFFVNGTRLMGAPTRDRLVRLIDEELAVAGKLAATGIPRAQLYGEITRDGLWDVPGSPLAKSP